MTGEVAIPDDSHARQRRAGLRRAAVCGALAALLALPAASAVAGELPNSSGVKLVSVSTDGKIGGGLEGFNHVTLLGADGKVERTIVLGARNLPPKPQRKPTAEGLDGMGGVDAAVQSGLVQFAALPLVFDPLRGVTGPESKLGRVGPGLLMLDWPIIGARLSSGYGPRVHPLLGGVRHHDGIDLAAPYGTPVRAAADGLISYRGRNGGYGRYVRIDHGFGMATAYGHLRDYAVGMAPGRRVRKGEVIGFVGSSGLSTGPHLHYEVIRDGRTLNPLDILPPQSPHRIVWR